MRKEFPPCPSCGKKGINVTTTISKFTGEEEQDFDHLKCRYCRKVYEADRILKFIIGKQVKA